jgi:hypothetical protein
MLIKLLITSTLSAEGVVLFFNLKAPTAVYKGAGGGDCVTNGVVEKIK